MQRAVACPGFHAFGAEKGQVQDNLSASKFEGMGDVEKS